MFQQIRWSNKNKVQSDILAVLKELTVDNLKNKSCVRLIGQAVGYISQSKIKSKNTLRTGRGT